MDSIVSKIRKLLQLADPSKNPNEEEAASAMRMATLLLSRHNLDLSDVQDPSPDQITGTAEHDIVTTWAPEDTWFAVVCNALAPLYFTKAIRHHHATDPKIALIRFYGKTHNVVTAALMAEYLRTTVLRQAQKAGIRATLRKEQGDLPLFVRSFCEGASSRLAGRIGDMVSERSKSSEVSAKGTTLPALVDNELGLVEQYIRENFPNLQNARRSRRKTNFSAYGQGATAARDISLSFQVDTAKNSLQLPHP